MKKILYVATSDIHLSTFHRPYINWFLNNGFQVDLAVENRGSYVFDGVSNTFNISFPRKLLDKRLILTYRHLKKIINNGKYDLIHCHTPIPSMLTRLAARAARRNGTVVLYTAHGFHFFKGAALSKWLIYYTSEFILSRFTDGIITINNEDFGYINNKMLHKESWYIPGIGVDSNRFVSLTDEERNSIRREFGFSNHDFILLYIAEFIPRKNHKFIIHSINKLANLTPNLKVIFVGKGSLLKSSQDLSNSLGLSSSIYFLGFRDDVEKICAIADVGVSSSKHEGLGLGLVEQMMCKTPVIATVDRGHKELIVHGYNGYLFEQSDTESFLKYLCLLYKNESDRLLLGKNAFDKAREFEVTNSLSEMIKIYNFYLLER